MERANVDGRNGQPEVIECWPRDEAFASVFYVTELPGEAGRSLVEERWGGDATLLEFRGPTLLDAPIFRDGDQLYAAAHAARAGADDRLPVDVWVGWPSKAIRDSLQKMAAMTRGLTVEAPSSLPG